MSKRNGDRSMYNRKRKAKIQQRERTRKLREELARPNTEPARK